MEIFCNIINAFYPITFNQINASLLKEKKVTL